MVGVSYLEDQGHKGAIPAQLALQAKPLAEHGTNQHDENGGHYDVMSKKQGNSSSYLTARIARDRPDILEKMKAGQYPSVRAAVKDASFIKEATPLQAAIRAWNKMSAAERRQFLTFVREQQQRAA